MWPNARDAGLVLNLRSHLAGLETCPQDESKLIYLWAGNAVIDGKYQLETCIGKGGMGVVYRACHTGLNRVFALKLVRYFHDADADGIEAEVQARGASAWDVTASEYRRRYRFRCRSAGIPYLVTEFLVGQTLEEFRREQAGTDLCLEPACRS